MLNEAIVSCITNIYISEKGQMTATLNHILSVKILDSVIKSFDTILFLHLQIK